MECQALDSGKACPRSAVIQALRHGTAAEPAMMLNLCRHHYESRRVQRTVEQAEPLAARRVTDHPAIIRVARVDEQVFRLTEVMATSMIWCEQCDRPLGDHGQYVFENEAGRTLGPRRP